MPAPPKVIVTFYENLRFVLEEKFNVFNKLDGIGIDGEGVYLGGSIEVEATGGSFVIVFKINSFQSGETGPIAHNASAATVAAALNATGIGSWTATDIGPSHWGIRMHGEIGSQPGFSGNSYDLTGPLEEVPHWEQVEYEVELEEGCGGSLKASEMKAGNFPGGPVPSRRTVSGQGLSIGEPQAPARAPRA